MPDVAVGGSGGGGVGGIPTKWLIIGGGAAALGLFFFMQKGQGATVVPGGPETMYGQALGPNAALALGDLQNRLLEQSGLIQEQSAFYFGSLQSQMDAQAAALGDQYEEGSSDLAELIGSWGGLLANQGWQTEELQRFFATRADYLAGRITLDQWNAWQEEARARAESLWGTPASA